MKFLVKTTDVFKTDADMVAVFAMQGKKSEDIVLSDEAKRVNRVLDGELLDLAVVEGYEASVGKTLVVHTHGKLPSRRVVLVGLGKLEDLTMFDLQTVAATIGRLAKSVGAKRVGIALSNDILDRFGVKATSQGIVLGMQLGTYVFLKHKEQKAREKEKMIDEVLFLTVPPRISAVSAGLAEGTVIADAVSFCRDLINEPPSVTTPTYLGDVAKQLVVGKKDMSCEVLGRAEMTKLGMGGILGIAQGSDEEPRFIKLSYKGSARKTICLVGKGITFDSGGLSLKPSEHMETMKLDMAGAAAVLSVFQALSILKPKVNVVGLISATENMPSGKAVKPGDIVRAMNGKTIEILNTDAEGRVVLADAMSYAAEKVKPDVMIDLATLTGACMVALGEDIAGIFANDTALAQALKTAAENTGEKLWELPLAREYKEGLKSTVADIKNITGKRYGGAINGALFLQEFVSDTTPWAHLDIAGPAFAEKDAPLTPIGGTGFGVRLLLYYLLNSS